MSEKTELVTTLNSAQEQLDTLTELITSTVNDIVVGCCQPLDDYMSYIDSILLSNDRPLSDNQLETYILNLSSLLYFTGSAQEDLGIKEDISKAIRKEAYSKARDAKSGTVADKDAYATLACQEEQLLNDAYSRAYKKVKIKVDAGTEMLNSLKKIMTRRIAETELSKSKYINTQRGD